MLRTEQANLQAELHAELHARLHNVKNVCAKLEVLDKLEELDALTNAAGSGDMHSRLACRNFWRAAHGVCQLLIIKCVNTRLTIRFAGTEHRRREARLIRSVGEVLRLEAE
jgi:hypothetical protein